MSVVEKLQSYREDESRFCLFKHTLGRLLSRAGYNDESLQDKGVYNIVWGLSCTNSRMRLSSFVKIVHILKEPVEAGQPPSYEEMEFVTKKYLKRYCDRFVSEEYKRGFVEKNIPALEACISGFEKRDVPDKGSLTFVECIKNEALGRGNSL